MTNIVVNNEADLTMLIISEKKRKKNKIRNIEGYKYNVKHIRYFINGEIKMKRNNIFEMTNENKCQFGGLSKPKL